MRRSEVRILPGVLSWIFELKRLCFSERVEIGRTERFRCDRSPHFSSKKRGQVNLSQIESIRYSVA